MAIVPVRWLVLCALREDILDRTILDSIKEALNPDILERAVAKAAAELIRAHSRHASRRTLVERELRDVQRRVDRLVDALADGSLPADEIRIRLTASSQRRRVRPRMRPSSTRLGRAFRRRAGARNSKAATVDDEDVATSRRLCT